MDDATDRKERFFLVLISSIGDCIFSGYPLSSVKTTRDIKVKLKKSKVHRINDDEAEGIYYRFVVMNVMAERRILEKIKRKKKKKKR